MKPNPERRQFLKLGVAAAAWACSPAAAWRARAAVGGSEELDLSRWLRPVPPQAMYSEPGYYVWCGTMVRGADGRCHLYYSRWPLEEGFAAWVTHSEIAQAVADQPLGPYRPVGVALPARGPDFWDGHCTHNPTVFAHGGKFYLYYMGNRGDRKRSAAGLNWTHRNNQRVGVAVADSPDGPWRRFDHPVIDVTPGFHDAIMASNPAVLARPDGSIEMIYKGVADKLPPPSYGPVVHVAATAPVPAGPFTKRPNAIFTAKGAAFPAEDPFIWRDGEKYWATVKDMKGYFTPAGRALVLMRSADGFDWEPAVHSLITRPEFRRADGTVQPLHALERPQLWFDGGVPAVLFCAAAISPPNKGEPTFNVAIPLQRPG